MNIDSKHNSYLTFYLKDEDIKKLKHEISDSKEDKGIRIKIEATHSGIVNGNKKFYLPVGMRGGTDSFVKPYPKPVTVNHDQYCSPLGRVVDSTYVSYGIGGQIENLRPVGITDSKSMTKIKNFIKSDVYKQDSYKGLGHIQLIAEITDKSAIDKIIDKRYLTVSIGGGSNAMYCSICGVDNKRKYCDHYPGQIYDGEECFFVAGDLMDFDHISYVNSPADKNTNTELMDSDDCRITILDYITLDKGKKMNLKDFLQGKFPTYKEVRDYMEGIGLASHINDDTSTVKELDFVLLDEKVLPIHDKAHAIAARLILQDAEIEDGDKTAALEVVDHKLTALIGEAFSINDELDKLKTAPKTTSTVQDNQKTVATITDEAINSIVSKVVDELKKSFNVSDSYSVNRLKSIQKVNDSLETEVQALTDKLRKNTITQILTLEDKLSDNDYRQKLEARNITSLEDKLVDLIAGASNQPKTDPIVDSKTLEPNSVDKTQVSDKVVEDDTSQKQSTDTSTNTNKLSTPEIVDEYKRLIREKGLATAKKYIQGLRDDKKLPDNFTFNGA